MKNISITAKSYNEYFRICEKIFSDWEIQVDAVHEQRGRNSKKPATDFMICTEVLHYDDQVAATDQHLRYIQAAVRKRMRITEMTPENEQYVAKLKLESPEQEMKKLRTILERSYSVGDSATITRNLESFVKTRYQHYLGLVTEQVTER